MASEAQLREFGRLICSVAAGRLMSRQESADAYRQVILNEQPELQQGAFLMAHITRGPSTEELSGAWDALDLHDTAKIHAQVAGPVCDIVGTGSDPLKTINCSTPAALIAAACGLPIAKKGARLVTGVSGASDILEIFGIDLNAPLSLAEKALNTHGLCYLPGESFLKSGWARLIQSMRFTSAFNIIGPLTRPCGKTNSIVIGAYAPHVCDQLIDVLKEIAMPAALAPFGMVEGMDPGLGMDEFSLSGPTRVVELRGDQTQVYEVTPHDFDLKRVPFSHIASLGTAGENARAILEVLSGRYDIPRADFFCMNAAAALYIAGCVPSYSKGTALAKEALATGKALQKLNELRKVQGKH
ncbi:anthranilate phosphoribosyltransferase [Desulforhabdus sp. TSK]|uniref:anthranilate phosphoribosyltransferase n=1 Tax=Desulforhabdus sp. TSK TaxID=2925014 RepID=UPI001FC87675|nr:anthranilate phosphoribosyltransferase [Desulforhabdus sp. TSK]GKT07249.1 anthranilate phosphoribosyltransferase [Desulforhabdus sp. TSK]